MAPICVGGGGGGPLTRLASRRRRKRSARGNHHRAAQRPAPISGRRATTSGSGKSPARMCRPTRRRRWLCLAPGPPVSACAIACNGSAKFGEFRRRALRAAAFEQNRAKRMRRKLMRRPYNVNGRNNSPLGKPFSVICQMGASVSCGSKNKLFSARRMLGAHPQLSGSNCFRRRSGSQPLANFLKGAPKGLVAGSADHGKCHRAPSNWKRLGGGCSAGRAEELICICICARKSGQCEPSNRSERTKPANLQCQCVLGKLQSRHRRRSTGARSMNAREFISPEAKPPV